MNKGPEIQEFIKYNDSVFLKTKSYETPNWWDKVMNFIKHDLSCFYR